MPLRMQAMSDESRQFGFTIVEVLVVITVLSILFVPIMYGLAGLYKDATVSIGKSTQDTDTRTALRAIDNELMNSVGFVGVEQVDSPLGAGDTGNDWTYEGDGNHRRVLIAKTYAMDKSPLDPTRLPIFMKPGSDCAAAADIALVTNVYFLASDPGGNGQYNLYRRTLLPSTSSGDYCTTSGASNVLPYQKQTCSSGCMAQDALLLRGVSEFDVDYFPLESSTASVASNENGKFNEVAAARRAVVTVKTVRKIDGEENRSIASISINAGTYVSLVNGNGITDDPNYDPATGSSCVSSSEYSTAGTHTHTIPACAEFITIIAIGGGGGGQGGSNLASSHGNGGNSGAWSYTTLQRGVDIDARISKLTVTVGAGGAGGNGYGTTWAELINPSNGSRGGSSSVVQVIPRVGTDIYIAGMPDGPLFLDVDWPGLTAVGGGGGHGYGLNGHPGNIAVPKTLSYMGQTYAAGDPSSIVGGAGSSPGGAGGGGQKQANFSSGGGKGGAGAPGKVWIRGY